MPLIAKRHFTDRPLPRSAQAHYLASQQAIQHARFASSIECGVIVLLAFGTTIAVLLLSIPGLARVILPFD